MRTSLLFLLASGVFGFFPGAAAALETPIVFTQIPIGTSAAVYEGQIPCPDGSRLVILDPDQSHRVITPEFTAACDPAVSFDGRTILFAGKQRPGDPFNIFEKGLDGSAIRQLTRDMGDCREPLCLPKASVSAPLFNDPVRWMAFTSTAAGVLDELGRHQAQSLYVTNLDPIDGRDPVLWRTTYNLGGVFSPTVLQDGRVLFSSYQTGKVKLMTVTWAGDNLNLFANAAGEEIQSMACERSGDRSVVLIESQALSRGGRLLSISLKRPLALRSNLSGEDGRYLTPHPLADGRVLVSFAADDSNFGIFVFDEDSGSVGRPVFDDPEYDDVDAIEVAPHPEPLARIPMLEFASVLDIEGFEDAGQLHCMSVYDSDEPAIQQLEPGSVKWVRFIQGEARSVEDQEQCGSDVGQSNWPPPCVETRILGQAPVEPDGSFFVNITGNIPFYIELLDEDQRILHSMKSWIWIRSKSQRGCIGCHENKELAPQNRATDALLKMQPTFITAGSQGHEEPSPGNPTISMKSSHDIRTSGGQP